jgi:hypothetical protein
MPGRVEKCVICRNERSDSIADTLEKGGLRFIRTGRNATFICRICVKYIRELTKHWEEV